MTKLKFFVRIEHLERLKRVTLNYCYELPVVATVQLNVIYKVVIYRRYYLSIWKHTLFTSYSNVKQIFNYPYCKFWIYFVADGLFFLEEPYIY